MKPGAFPAKLRKLPLLKNHPRPNLRANARVLRGVETAPVAPQAEPVIADEEMQIVPIADGSGARRTAG